MEVVFVIFQNTQNLAVKLKLAEVWPEFRPYLKDRIIPFKLVIEHNCSELLRYLILVKIPHIQSPQIKLQKLLQLSAELGNYDCFRVVESFVAPECFDIGTEEIVRRAAKGGNIKLIKYLELHESYAQSVVDVAKKWKLFSLISHKLETREDVEYIIRLSDTNFTTAISAIMIQRHKVKMSPVMVDIMIDNIDFFRGSYFFDLLLFSYGNLAQIDRAVKLRNTQEFSQADVLHALYNQVGCKLEILKYMKNFKLREPAGKFIKQVIQANLTEEEMKALFELYESHNIAMLFDVGTPHILRGGNKSLLDKYYENFKYSLNSDVFSGLHDDVILDRYLSSLIYASESQNLEFVKYVASLEDREVDDLSEVVFQAFVNMTNSFMMSDIFEFLALKLKFNPMKELKTYIADPSVDIKDINLELLAWFMNRCDPVFKKTMESKILKLFINVTPEFPPINKPKYANDDKGVKDFFLAVIKLYKPDFSFIQPMLEDLVEVYGEEIIEFLRQKYDSEFKIS